MYRLFVFLLAALALAGCADRTVREVPMVKTATGEHGMVVSAHAAASQSGIEVLQAGGNAVDAAVATGFALAVVHPAAGNLGGGGFMVIRQPDGRATTFDFREKAPAAATRDMFLDENGDFVPRRSQYGHLASGVPGSPAGLLLAHQRYGRLPLDAVMAPAIRLAERGFVLTRRHADGLNAFAESFMPFAGSRRYFVREGGFQAGDVLRQRDLADVLRRIRSEGQAGFYRGRTADLIVAEMQRGGGLVTHADLEAYDAVERAPVEGDYRGHRVISMPPPSSGGVALVQLLNAVEPYDLAAMGPLSSETIHLMAEAMRRVYADRAEWLGDADYVEVPVEQLVDPAYMQARMASFLPDRVTPSDRIDYGDPYALESTETTHYSVVDAEGRAVSVTTTLNGSYGSKVAVDGAGFLLNNEMDDFSAKPGVPNMFGLVGSEANQIEPGKRMLSSMTPTIVEDPQGRLMLVIGTPGGSTIITTVFQIIVHLIDFEMSLAAAIDAPRVHHQWLPDLLYYERHGLPADVVRNLEARGWTAQQRRGRSGRADGIRVRYVGPRYTDAAGVEEVEGRGGRLYVGVADPRGEDAAVGY